MLKRVSVRWILLLHVVTLIWAILPVIGYLSPLYNGYILWRQVRPYCVGFFGFPGYQRIPYQNDWFASYVKTSAVYIVVYIIIASVGVIWEPRDGIRKKTGFYILSIVVAVLIEACGSMFLSIIQCMQIKGLVENKSRICEIVCNVFVNNKYLDGEGEYQQVPFASVCFMVTCTIIVYLIGGNIIRMCAGFGRGEYVFLSYVRMIRKISIVVSVCNVVGMVYVYNTRYGMNRLFGSGFHVSFVICSAIILWSYAVRYLMRMRGFDDDKIQGFPINGSK